MSPAENEECALAQRLLAGDRSALARALTRIERDERFACRFDPLLAAHTGRCQSVGITGAPGAGKSTLVGALLQSGLKQNRRMAVLALDPASALTRGAILGDRLRMDAAAGDERVFVRSMTAGMHGGGLSAVTPLVIRALDAAGWPWVLIETVGVGQTEFDIVEAATTAVVVLNPGWGDEVQTIKAGLLEMADIFVINKCDREGANQTRLDLQRMLSVRKPCAWTPLIVQTVASEGWGIEDLWSAIEWHGQHLDSSGERAGRRRRLLGLAARELARASLNAKLEMQTHSPRFATLLDGVLAGRDTIHEAATHLLEEILHSDADRETGGGRNG